ncbi:MAG: hypothetical protein A4S09_05510 [Proteobacteria bacterium SG_bin7]|nr:MAG: hypothetical protein A4S09_05510 [Proteobacteria bacterium SG_bin7]
MKCYIFMFCFLSLGLMACSPKFATTAPKDTIFGKADAQSILGSWIYNRTEKTHTVTIRMDIEIEKVRYDETCIGANTEVGIRTVSRALVGKGKIAFIDAIFGTVQNGDLRCGLEFSATEYPVAISGNTLTLKTPTGTVSFERIKNSTQF